MSNIKSKDLSYDKSASQPAFLQRLRDQNNAITSSGRHEQPVARAQRQRTKNDDDEDAPTYVVEGSSETLTKAEYEKLTSTSKDDDADIKFGDAKDMVTGELLGQSPKASGALPNEEKTAAAAPTRNPGTVDVGATKKRKVAKVVGGDDNEEEETEAKDATKSDDKPKKKMKKKGKPIKLSFGDEE